MKVSYLMCMMVMCGKNSALKNKIKIEIQKKLWCYAKFQLFKHTTDSYGALYLTLMNLPRVERFKQEKYHSGRNYTTV